MSVKICRHCAAFNPKRRPHHPLPCPDASYMMETTMGLSIQQMRTRTISEFVEMSMGLSNTWKSKRVLSCAIYAT